MSRGGKNRRARERRSQESFHQSQEIFARATCCKICNLKFWRKTHHTRLTRSLICL
jgi:hypothetical protein